MAHVNRAVYLSAPFVPESDIESAARLLGDLGMSVGAPERVASGPDAVRIDTAGGPEPDAVRDHLAPLRSDVCVQPAALRPGAALIVLDVDSTFLEQEVIELLADHAGARAEVAAVTERAMQGELDFAMSLRQRVATLAGLPVRTLDDVVAAVRPTPGARELVDAAADASVTIGLVSGGFREIVEPVAADFGITRVVANRLQVADGRLTGRVEGAIVDATAKLTALRGFADDLAVDMSRTVAVGDGANDLEMLHAAGLGIAFDAKPAVVARADTHLSFRRLDAVLAPAGLRG